MAEVAPENVGQEVKRLLEDSIKRNLAAQKRADFELTVKTQIKPQTKTSQSTGQNTGAPSTGQNIQNRRANNQQAGNQPDQNKQANQDNSGQSIYQNQDNQPAGQNPAEKKEGQSEQNQPTAASQSPANQEVKPNQNNLNQEVENPVTATENQTEPVAGEQPAERQNQTSQNANQPGNTNQIAERSGPLTRSQAEDKSPEAQQEEAVRQYWWQRMLQQRKKQQAEKKAVAITGTGEDAGATGVLKKFKAVKLFWNNLENVSLTELDAGIIAMLSMNFRMFVSGVENLDIYPGIGGFLDVNTESQDSVKKQAPKLKDQVQQLVVPKLEFYRFFIVLVVDGAILFLVLFSIIVLVMLYSCNGPVKATVGSCPVSAADVLKIWWNNK